MWFSKSNFKPEGKTALVIGASQGVGADLALKLYHLRCSVILVARTEEKLINQAEEIERSASINDSNSPVVSYVACDVSDYDQCADLWKTITIDRQQDPDYIFCCAGSSIPKLFNDLTGADLASGIDLNYKTALNVVHSGFKQTLAIHQDLKFNEHKLRHVVLFSSVVAFYPFIGYAQYAPLKAAISSLSVVLRQELGPYNYRVSCVFPGNFASDGFLEEQKTKPEITKQIEGPSSPIPSSKCADMIIDSLSKGYDTITTDFIGWLLGCSVLGVLPRSWSVFQIIVSFIFLIIAPLANWVVYRDIIKYFQKRANHDNSSSKNKFDTRSLDSSDKID